MKAALLLTLALGAAPFAAAQSPVPASQSANRFAASIKPAETFESGPLLVERHGSKGRPVILIPGLASGPWVWQDVIRQFKDEFTLYVVTLPGFDGRPAPAGEPFEGARAALEGLIAQRKLNKPILVGHSLGGGQHSGQRSAAGLDRHRADPKSPPRCQWSERAHPRPYARRALGPAARFGRRRSFFGRRDVGLRHGHSDSGRWRVLGASVKQGAASTSGLPFVPASISRPASPSQQESPPPRL